MTRPGDFPFLIKMQAYNRQGGRCASCGVKLIGAPIWDDTPQGQFFGEAHHLRPLAHGGQAAL